MHTKLCVPHTEPGSHWDNARFVSRRCLLCSFQQCIPYRNHPGSVAAVFVRRMQMCAGIKALQ